MERETLGIIFGFKKLNKFLYGCSFTLVTDYKPLGTILSPISPIPMSVAAHLQHWALLLSAYQFTVQFRPTAKHGNAHALSRLPLSTKHPDVFGPVPSAVNVLHYHSKLLSWKQQQIKTEYLQRYDYILWEGGLERLTLSSRYILIGKNGLQLRKMYFMRCSGCSLFKTQKACPWRATCWAPTHSCLNEIAGSSSCLVAKDWQRNWICSS